MSLMTLKAVGLLGPVEAWSADGEPVRLGPLRQQAVFALLALRPNAPVSSAALVDALWAGCAPTSARQLVHTYVCRLRRAIAPEAARWNRRGILSNTAGGYLLSL